MEVGLSILRHTHMHHEHDGPQMVGSKGGGVNGSTGRPRSVLRFKGSTNPPQPNPKKRNQNDCTWVLNGG